MIKKRYLLLFLFCVFILIIGSLIILKNKKEIVLEEYEIFHDEKFGGVYVRISIDDFNNLGFNYGDSVDVSFSNGKELLDIPYYNGYYVDYYQPLVISYPGTEFVKIGLNYGDDLWFKYNLYDGYKVTIKLNESKKYLKIQKARDIHYSNIQGNQTDEEFANFRSVKVNNIKPNILYRSASPINNYFNRSAVADRLAKEVNIKYVVNLSDNEEEINDFIKSDDFNSPYYLSLYNNKKVILLSMNVIFNDKDFTNKLVWGLTSMSKNDGPYLVHCVEGKDRTGFAIMVLEALIGSTYDEIIDDYMETYKNYYSITKESDIERYNAIKEINIDNMLRLITSSDSSVDLTKIDYETKTKEYLLSIGMEEQDIDNLKIKLMK